MPLAFHAHSHGAFSSALADSRPVMQVAPVHTPEEMRQISNLAHDIEGTVIGLAALVVMIQATGRLADGRRLYLWPAIIVAAGVALLLYLLIPHHGLAHARAQWRFVFGDPQQRQHIFISAIILAAGTIELLGRAGQIGGRGWALAWPASLIVVGGLFIVHRQHGTSDAVVRATLVHRYLGAVLVAAGILSAWDAMRARHTGGVTFAWGLALLTSAALLFVYREPPGAYHDTMSGMGSDPASAHHITH